MESAGDFKRAVECHSAGQFAAAETAYRQILRTEPDHAEALQLLGVLLVQLGRPTAGIELMQRSLSLNDNQPGVHANIGNAFVAVKQYATAIEHFGRADALAPGFPAAWINHGGALISLGRLEEAVASCSHASALAPHHVVPILNRAQAQEGLARYEAALADYDRAIELRADLAVAHTRRGALLLKVNRPADALESLDHAVRADPKSAPAQFSRAITLLQLGLVEQAAAGLETLERLDPYYEGALGWRLYVQMMRVDWSNWEQGSTAICEAIRAGHHAAPPLAFLALSDSAELQLRCAELFAHPGMPAPAPRWTGERYRHERLRIAYLSSDLSEHALSFLMAGVFERHDARRFEIMALALRKDTDSAMGRRVRAAFARVIDVEGIRDAEIAAMVRAEEIDILIDLMGHTGGSRVGVLAHRPAPLQVNYLGFPGTVGRSIADYLIADEFVIPPETRACYGESIVYLPDCFQANDERRAAAPGACSRSQMGLPDDAFVWCSFHSSYKINPPMFDLWVHLLLAIPDSVLWIYCPDAATECNIRREAALRGLDPRRVVAAARVPYAEHLARLSLADLCLDTWPFNGGSTTSDALWAGVPVITCAGRSFAARMSGSLLRCMGLSELVGRSLEDYERIALDLALHPQRLRELRDRLGRSKSVSPLFDSARFCRYLEAAYIEMHGRHERGELPSSLSVPRTP